MLVENSTYNAGDVINIKLVSGDEIVGRLVNRDTQGYVLNKPCVVVTSSDGIGLVQAMFGLDPEQEPLRYKDEHVITVCHTHEPMRNHYNRVTTAE